MLHCVLKQIWFRKLLFISLFVVSFRKAGGPEKCGQELKKIYETLKTQINPVLCDAQTHPRTTYPPIFR